MNIKGCKDHPAEKVKNTAASSRSSGSGNRQFTGKGDMRPIEEFNDEVFILSVVITVGKNETINIVLDARSLNDALSKGKFQMLTFVNLMEECKVRKSSLQKLSEK